MPIKISTALWPLLVMLTSSVLCPYTLFPPRHLLPFTLDDFCVNTLILLCSLAQETDQYNGNTKSNNSVRHLVSHLIGPWCLIYQPFPILRRANCRTTGVSKGFQNQARSCSVFREGLSPNRNPLLTPKPHNNLLSQLFLVLPP